MAMGLIVSKEAFKGAEGAEGKLLLIYDIMVHQNKLLEDHIEKQDKTCDARNEACQEKFKKYDNRKKVDAGVAAAGGILGGFMAVIIKANFWK